MPHHRDHSRSCQSPPVQGADRPGRTTVFSTAFADRHRRPVSDRSIPAAPGLNRSISLRIHDSSMAAGGSGREIGCSDQSGSSPVCSATTSISGTASSARGSGAPIRIQRRKSAITSSGNCSSRRHFQRFVLECFDQQTLRNITRYDRRTAVAALSKPRSRHPRAARRPVHPIPTNDTRNNAQSKPVESLRSKKSTSR